MDNPRKYVCKLFTEKKIYCWEIKESRIKCINVNLEKDREGKNFLKALPCSSLPLRSAALTAWDSLRVKIPMHRLHHLRSLRCYPFDSMLQGPCCTSGCTLRTGEKCRDDNGCRDPSFCNGLAPQCPPSINKPNKTICNDEFVCYMGVSRIKIYKLFSNQLKQSQVTNDRTTSLV